jgi:tRNA threonylcarbamoyladenosine biosynthesis protein TsaE
MSFRFHLEQIDLAVDYLDEHLSAPVICFDGLMGAGKTTLISKLCQKWQVTDAMSSPTFSIVNHYESKIKGRIYHFDFYRLKNINEALDIGIEEYLDSKNYCLIEWGERISPLLPSQLSTVKIEVEEDQSRIINIVNT